MKYILDTNTCVYFLNGTYRSIYDRIQSLNPSVIAIPSMVKAELLLGAWKSQRVSNNLERVRSFLRPYDILGFDDDAAEIYAQVRASLEKRGTPIGPNDMIIASIALAHNGVLVTRNTGEFQRVPNLMLENWVITS